MKNILKIEKLKSLLSSLIRYCLLNDKKYPQKVWSKDLVYKGTFRLSSRTPEQFNVMPRTNYYYYYYTVYCVMLDSCVKTRPTKTGHARRKRK